MPRFLFTADWHLAAGAWVREPLLRGDQRFALQQLAAIAEEYKVSAVLAAGDLFDTNRICAADLEAAFSCIDRLTDKGIAFYFVQGQHEREPGRPWLGLHSAAVHLHTKTVDLADGFDVYGLDWQPADRLPAALAKIPRYTRLFMGHQVWQELAPFGATPEGALAEIPTVDYVLTGDMHRHQLLKLDGAGPRTITVFSPGALAMQAVDESYEKHVFLVTIPPGGSGLTSKSVPLFHRPFLRYVLPDATSLEALLNQRQDVIDEIHTHCSEQQLPPELQTAIVRVAFSDDIPAARTRLQQWAEQIGAVLFAKPVASDQLVAAAPEEELAGSFVSALPVSAEADQEVASRLEAYRFEDAVYELAETEAVAEDVVALWQDPQPIACLEHIEKTWKEQDDHANPPT